MITIKPQCDMLLDQNLTIDGDPVGSRCQNEATLQGYGLFFCQRCADLLAAGSERVTIPKVGGVPLWASGSVQAMVGRMRRAKQ